MRQQVVRFEVHPATKQTRERVLNALRSVAETSKRTGKTTVGLSIIYGQHVGPALFTFKNGVPVKVTPYKGYSAPRDIIFAVVS